MCARGVRVSIATNNEYIVIVILSWVRFLFKLIFHKTSTNSCAHLYGTHFSWVIFRPRYFGRYCFPFFIFTVFFTFIYLFIHLFIFFFYVYLAVVMILHTKYKQRNVEPMCCCECALKRRRKSIVLRSTTYLNTQLHSIVPSFVFIPYSLYVKWEMSQRK